MCMIIREHMILHLITMSTTITSTPMIAMSILATPTQDTRDPIPLRLLILVSITTNLIKDLMVSTKYIIMDTMLLLLLLHHSINNNHNILTCILVNRDHLHHYILLHHTMGLLHRQLKTIQTWMKLGFRPQIFQLLQSQSTYQWTWLWQGSLQLLQLQPLFCLNCLHFHRPFKTTSITSSRQYNGLSLLRVIIVSNIILQAIHVLNNKHIRIKLLLLMTRIQSTHLFQLQQNKECLCLRLKRNFLGSVLTLIKPTILITIIIR